MFHRTTLLRLIALDARDGAASVEHSDRFYKHLARLYGPMLTHRRKNCSP